MYILCHELLCYLYFLQTKSFISIMLIKIYIHILVHSNTLTQNQIHHTLNLIYTHQPYYHPDISKHINSKIHNQHKHFVHNIARLHQHVNIQMLSDYFILPLYNNLNISEHSFIYYNING